MRKPAKLHSLRAALSTPTAILLSSCESVGPGGPPQTRAPATVVWAASARALPFYAHKFNDV